MRKFVLAQVGILSNICNVFSKQSVKQIFPVLMRGLLSLLLVFGGITLGVTLTAANVYTLPSDGTALPAASVNPADRNHTVIQIGSETVMDTVSGSSAMAATVTTVNFEVAYVLTPPSCGASDGGVDLILTNIISPYTIDWPDLPGNNDPEDRSGLHAGNYQVTITDGAGLSQTHAILLSNAISWSAQLEVTPPLCSGGTGSMQVLADGVGLNYFWSNSQTGGSAGNLTPGIYTVTVVDAVNCAVFLSDTITEPPAAIVINETIQSVRCYGEANGSITVSVTNGTAPFKFDWMHIAGADNGPNLTGLSAGIYVVTVTDVNNCTATESFIVTQPSSISLSTSVISAICGQSNGIISLQAAGGIPPYTYQWSNGVLSNQITGLAAGIYTVTFTDANTCTATTSATITPYAPPLTVSLAVTPDTCGQGKGRIVPILTGGLGPYFFDWAHIPGSNDAMNATNLHAGTYTVTVVDSYGCSQTATAVVPTVNFQVQYNLIQPDCLTSNGSIDLVFNNIASPYAVDWFELSGNNDPEDRSGISAGSYRVTITDAAGCLQTHDILLSNVIIWNAELIVNQPPCTGATGNMQVVADGAGLSYVWSNNQTGSFAGNLTPGIYTVTLTDAVGCTVFLSDTMTVLPAMIISGLVQPVSCFGGNNGSISVTVNNGSAPFQFTWSMLGSGNTPDVNNLTAGSYTVTVTDGNGCTATKLFFVVQSPPILVFLSSTPAICGQSNGTINLQIVGETSPFLLTWSNDVGPVIIIYPPPIDLGLPSGTYTVTVTDTKGCTGTASTTIGSIEITSVLITPSIIPCPSLANGVLQAQVTGGALPYAFQWTNSANVVVSVWSSANGLSDGETYTLLVTDANGCTKTSSYTFPVTNTNYQVASCADTYTIVPTGGTPPFSYMWSNGMTTASGILAPGNYTVTVTDNNNCSGTETVYAEPNPLPCTTIQGQIGRDQSENCAIEPGETTLANIFVRAQSANATFYGFTDTDGNYTIRVQPGAAYVVEPTGNLPVNSIVCAPVSYTTPVMASGVQETQDFVLFVDTICPQLSVELSTNLLRRCFSNNIYTLQWCNLSPYPVNDAYITLKLDDDMSFVSSVQPSFSIGSNTRRFNLGNLDPYECGTFNVTVSVGCSNVLLGQVHCSTATIFPNGPCDPTNNWNGANVIIRSVCANDSLHFIVKNVGSATMTDALQYIVIEDGIMSMQQQQAPLAAGDSLHVALPANGSTWRLEANQEPTYPGQNVPVLSVEGCSTVGNFSVGYVQQFPNGNLDPHVATLCEPNVGSWDPNDKMGIPLGYGSNHYIRPGTTIDYRIRFQNTGTDTAFAVVIRDTLSPWFDMASVRPGAGSHPYRFEFVGENIVVFDFEGIVLPDSNVNVAGSQGFVYLQITPKDSTPLETDLYNRAAIYFDFNEPVITNTTHHRVGINFLTVGLWEPREPEYTVSVTPNPTAARAQIKVLGYPEAYGDFELQLYDARGQLQFSLHRESPIFTLEQGILKPGIYGFSVKNKGVLVGNGKLVVSE